MQIINSELSDIDMLFKIYDGATLYQQQVFHRSWKGFDRERVLQEIREGKQWKIVVDGQIACVFCIEYNDPFIWGEKDKDPAIYIHRIATNPEFRGRGMVKEIVQWSKGHAIEKEKRFIRMDTGSGNSRLNTYYIGCGFMYLGVTDIKNRELLPEHYKTGMFSLFEINLELDAFRQLPPNLPIPIDDGACDHLVGAIVPNIPLPSTNNEEVLLKDKKERIVLYCYPMTGAPEIKLPDGWDAIPGARGCTPQSCSFRDHYQELKELDTEVYGMSIQTVSRLKQEKERIHLPFDLLSDATLEWSSVLKLPTFEAERVRYLKRVTLIIENGRIVKYFYPIFPPDKNGGDVVAWVQEQVSNKVL
ncbi:GNAT family N-acetyltransferase [Flavobacterium sp. '19STA2R22 D10 B1']|uniref:GNAT family N-acetyltransferase n=1 Tax=Flavobacterium aerium TaxID=3037261 RepID=UPI00278BC0DD|nr:GNAT family N-acetyltransferase [Flavobacterium sp. '19STA2R22 D10 B1']